MEKFDEELEIEVNDLDGFNATTSSKKDEEKELEKASDTSETPKEGDTEVRENSVESSIAAKTSEKEDEEQKASVKEKTEEKTKEETEDIEDKDAIIKALRESLVLKDGEILSLKSDRSNESESQKDKKKNKDEASDIEEHQEPPKNKVPEDIDFIGELHIDDLTATKESMNAMFNKVFKQAVDYVSQQQNVVGDRTPDINAAVKKQVSEELYINKLVDTFYLENKDLTAFRPTVGAIAAAIAQEHPDYTFPQLFEEAGKKTREILKLPVQKKQKVKEDSEFENPAFAGKTNRRETPSAESTLQQEIDEL